MKKQKTSNKKIVGLYTKAMLSQQKIADILGTTQHVIHLRLKEENINCAEIYKKRKENTWIRVVCSFCGNNLKRRKCNTDGYKNYYCNKKCEAKHRTFGENTELKGSYTDMGGYKYHKINGKYRAEHRIVVEREIGRTLESYEFIHHLNGIRKDNRIENLTIVTNKTHESGTIRRLLQKRIRELEEQLEKINET